MQEKDKQVLEEEVRCLLHALSTTTKDWGEEHSKHQGLTDKMITHVIINAQFNLAMDSYYTLLAHMGYTHAESLDLMSKHLMRTLECKLKKESAMASMDELLSDDLVPEGELH